MISHALLRAIVVAIVLSALGAACLKCSARRAWNLGAPLGISLPVAEEPQKPQEVPNNRSDRKSNESFVNLTVKLGEDGSTEIARATQVDGKLIERQVPATNYVYEITKGGKAYSVGFLPEGAFSLRGFKD